MFWKLLRETIAKNVPKKTHCCVGYLYVGCSKSATSFVNVLEMYFHDFFYIVGDIHDNICYQGHDNENITKSLIFWTFIFHVMLKKFTSCLARSEKNLSIYVSPCCSPYLKNKLPPYQATPKSTLPLLLPPLFFTLFLQLTLLLSL